MSKRAGVKIIDRRDNNQTYRLYRSIDGDIEKTGKELTDKIQEYIGRNNLYNLYDLYESIYNDIDYKLVDEDCWDEEYRYYIEIISDTELKYTIASIDFKLTEDPKNPVYTDDVTKIFNIETDKPNYHIKLSQEERDFIKNCVDKIANDEDIVTEKRNLAKSIEDKI